MIVHQMIHWPDEGDKDLWPFALEYAVCIWNRLPNKDSGYAPMELWTRMKNDHTELLRAKVWRCPAYVLEPKLQDGKKIPKWNKRSPTKTVPNTGQGEMIGGVPDNVWSELIETSHDSGEDSDDSDGNGPAAAHAPGRVTRSGRQTTSGFCESNYDRGQWFTPARKRQGTSFQAMQPPNKVKSGKRDHTKKHHHNREKIRKQELNESYLASLDWTRVKDEFRTGDWGLFEKLIDENEEDGLIE
eukprot:scaffold7769_cov53-Attheya_sp.AAC.3